MEEKTLGANLKILVVEDSAMSFALTSAMIERITGVIPDRAHDGEEALEMLEMASYDIVFMDYFMPKLNGVETTRRIRNRMGLWPQPTVIGLSGAIAPRDVKECQDAGMDHFLAKPLRLPKLQQVIQSLTVPNLDMVVS